MHRQGKASKCDTRPLLERSQNSLGAARAAPLMSCKQTVSRHTLPQHAALRHFMQSLLFYGICCVLTDGLPSSCDGRQSAWS